MIWKNRTGFTLMELLVYMAIVGIIVVIAGEAFSKSTKFRVRTSNMLKAAQEAENISTLFREDVSQMGAKAAVEVGATTKSGADKFTYPYNNPYITDDDQAKYAAIYEKVYMDPDTALPHTRDSSSFLLATTNGFSDLTMRRVRYTANGGYKAVEEIRWFVDGNAQLKRSCRTIVGTTDDEDLCNGTDKSAADAMENAVVMATGVRKFEVRAAKPTAWEDSLVFPSVPYSMRDDSVAERKYFRLIPRTGDDDGIFRYHSFISMNQDNEENAPDTLITLSGFKVNYDEENKIAITDNDSVDQVIAVNPRVNGTGFDPDNWRDFCKDWGGPHGRPLTLEKDATYEISFEMPYERPFKSLEKNYDVSPFVIGEDHMSIGFRDYQTGTIPKVNGRYVVDDFMFYPPYNTRGREKRIMRFSVPVEVNSVCLALTFARYSPRRAKEPAFKIRNLQLRKIAGAKYDFNDESFNPENQSTAVSAPTKQDKKNIRALKMKLQISRGSRDNLSGETGNVDIVIPIPSNGPRH